jgi:hypothetical protein
VILSLLLFFSLSLCTGRLGGPDPLDVRRFELRIRTQLLKHVLGWRLHTLEPIEKGQPALRCGVGCHCVWIA